MGLTEAILKKPCLKEKVRRGVRASLKVTNRMRLKAEGELDLDNLLEPKKYPPAWLGCMAHSPQRCVECGWIIFISLSTLSSSSMTIIYLIEIL